MEPGKLESQSLTDTKGHYKSKGHSCDACHGEISPILHHVWAAKQNHCVNEHEDISCYYLQKINTYAIFNHVPKAVVSGKTIKMETKWM